MNSPLQITSRLAPGFVLGDAEISFETTDRRNPQGKPAWRMIVEIRSASTLRGHQSTIHGWGDAASIASAGLSFLSACAEAYGYRMRTGTCSDNVDLFPEWVAEWAYQNSDELAILQLELDESKPSS